jgi:hypothetical protein
LKQQYYQWHPKAMLQQRLLKPCLSYTSKLRHDECVVPTSDAKRGKTNHGADLDANAAFPHSYTHVDL